MKIEVKRIYEQPAPEDGLRILVDRLWPRGLAKEAAKVDVWFKSIAPSNELRIWYQHDPQKWAEFKTRYFAELDEKNDVLDEFIGQLNSDKITFLYAAKDTQHNNAVALKEYIDNYLK